jgi:hypothetical protein
MRYRSCGTMKENERGDGMMRLELTDRERAVLNEVLESSLTELRTEVAHTDNRDYRAGLKERETVLVHILSRLMSSPQS